MVQLQKVESQIRDLGYQIVAVSADSPANVAAIEEKTHFEYTLLSDNDLVLAQALGIAYRVDDETFGKLKRYDIDIEQASERDHRLLPVPSVFVLDRKGVVQFVYVNPDYRVRIEPEVLLAAAKAFKK